MEKLKTILFLCTGNYCRSGMNNIGPMATAAIKTLEAMGIRDAERCGRFPAQVTIAELEQADVIVALTHAEHLPHLQGRFPAFAERVEFWLVDDALEALALIESKVNDLVARLLGGCGEALFVMLAHARRDLARRPQAPLPREKAVAA